MADHPEHIPPVGKDDLSAVGVRLRTSSDPQSRGYDPLERFLRVPNHAMFLFTSEDRLLDAYIREHWSALDGLSGEACDIHVSLLQLGGEEDFYTQLDDVRSIRGIDAIKPSDLPALHIWSDTAACTVSLARCETEAALRDAIRSVFTVIHSVGGPITNEDVSRLLHSMRCGTSAEELIPRGQHVAQSSAGRDIIQTTNIHYHHPEGARMSQGPEVPSAPGQVIEDVNAGKGISQKSDSATDSQTIRRAETSGEVTQSKGATSEMSFGWGRARGWGIIGLVVAFLAWLVYRYLSGS